MLFIFFHLFREFGFESLFKMNLLDIKQPLYELRIKTINRSLSFPCPPFFTNVYFDSILIPDIEQTKAGEDSFPLQDSSSFTFEVRG